MAKTMKEWGKHYNKKFKRIFIQNDIYDDLKPIAEKQLISIPLLVRQILKDYIKKENE